MKIKIEHNKSYSKILFPRLKILKNGGHLTFWVNPEDVPNKIFKNRVWKKDDFINDKKIEFQVFIHKKFIYDDPLNEGFKIVYIPENFTYDMRFSELHYKEKLNKELKITGKDLVNKYFIHDIVNNKRSNNEYKKGI